MAFQSGTFFVLFLATLLVYHAVPKALKLYTLLLAGCIFYAPAGVAYFVLLGVAVLLSYTAARCMDAASTDRKRRVIFWVALALLLGNLCFFKYYNLFGTAMNQMLASWGWPVLLPDKGLLAPLGISFYTFVMLGYLIDVYQKVRPAERHLARYAVFASFFPLIASGPIERGEAMLPQLEEPRAFSYDDFSSGAARILWGFFKKFLVANLIAIPVDRVFGDMSSYTGPYLLLAGLLYSYQIYCDFSGYSDIAIGVARTLGFRVRENFTRPFAARSFTELWQRWHISLTSWFRDYVFTPLSFSLRGSRWPALVGALCLFVIFPLSGIWHGATLAYFVWGVLNGIYMVVGRLTAKRRRKLAKKNPLYRNAAVKAVLQIVMVYLLFTSCIVFFRAQTIGDALYWYAHVFTGWVQAVIAPAQAFGVLKELNIGRLFLLLCGGGAVLIECVEWRAAQKGVTTGEWMQAQKTWVRLPLYYALLLLLAFYGMLGASSFIYFQF